MTAQELIDEVLQQTTDLKTGNVVPNLSDEYLAKYSQKLARMLKVAIETLEHYDHEEFESTAYTDGQLQYRAEKTLKELDRIAGEDSYTLG